jgi:hypothetical protein
MTNELTPTPAFESKLIMAIQQHGHSSPPAPLLYLPPNAITSSGNNNKDRERIVIIIATLADTYRAWYVLDVLDKEVTSRLEPRAVCLAKGIDLTEVQYDHRGIGRVSVEPTQIHK